MPDIAMTVISPEMISGRGELGQYDLGRFDKKCLAQGDSWFSIGHLPPWSTTNLLQQMVLSKSVVAVNCARPGIELSHMTDGTNQQEFLRLLRGPLAYRWDGILLSGGGNDIIDAALSPATNSADQRLFLNTKEWPTAIAAGSEGSAFISELGWQSFRSHMNDVFDQFVEERDRGINNGVPLFFHTYDFLTPRNAPAGPGFGPWLYKALNDVYGISPLYWQAVADELLGRLRTLLQGIVNNRPGKNLHLIDSLGTLAAARPRTQGVDGDWENEIHPTPHGYSLLARKWRAELDATL
ncbi:MAG: hypothetical protein WCH35_13500 [Comamonadaceae bacterium]